MKSTFKNFFQNIVLFILTVFFIFVFASVFLVFYTRHHLDFDPADKDIEKAVIYGDVRSGYVTHMQIANMIESEKPNMVLFTGDIASNSRNYIHYLQFALFEKKLWDNADLHTGFMIYFLNCQIIHHTIHLIEWVCILLCLTAGMFLTHWMKNSLHG